MKRTLPCGKHFLTFVAAMAITMPTAFAQTSPDVQPSVPKPPVTSAPMLVLDAPGCAYTHSCESGASSPAFPAINTPGCANTHSCVSGNGGAISGRGNMPAGSR